MPSPFVPLQKLVSALNRLEEIVLCLLMSLMVLLGSFLILSRNFFQISLFWIDPVLRHVVLWVALLGASIATREERHISIDLLSTYLKPPNRQRMYAGLFLFSAVNCFLLVWPSINFVQQEYQIGKSLAPGIPVWLAQSIMPIMLAVLGVRFLGKTWAAFKRATHPLQSEQ
jgi:TRAP-type C4-dicarboxylate transport system permease small subunit